MADFSKLIKEKGKAADYMVDEITHICRDLPKRDPGSEGEKVACEYMADVLKDCGCENVAVEAFQENPGSFYGWLYITLTCALLGFVCMFVLPPLGIAFVAIGLITMFLQFGFYKKFVDKLFPEKTGHNVTAIKKCTGEVKGRIFFNGHPDAAWEWPVNRMLGGVGFEGHAVLGIGGALYYLVINCLLVANGFTVGVITDFVANPTIATLYKCALGGIAFIPFIILLYRMWNKNLVVDGANDNLTGCYMGIAILKQMKEAGIELEHTEVGVILSGSEEAGLRGAKAWCEQHKGEFEDVPTWIYSYDTIHDAKQLMVNYRDLNGTVKSDKEIGDSFIDAAKELDIFCKKGWVPPLGGATDSAAFAQGGFRATGITGLNHKLESYYHTRYDSYDNLDKVGLADCYAVSVKCLENFDNKVNEK